MGRPRPEQLAAAVRPLAERAVTTVGFDLEDLEIRQAGRRLLVRVVVDADSGVGLDDIATLSRRISAELDQHDDILGGPYTLEVTSPGVDRPLTAPRHWRRARLRLVEVALRDEGKITGRVGDAGEDAVRLLVDGKLRDVRYQDVERAAVVVEFKQPPSAELRALAEDRAESSDDSGGTPEAARAMARDREDVGEAAEEHK